MNRPVENRNPTSSVLRAAGVGLGMLGAFGGAAGWFTLVASDPAASAVVVSTANGDLATREGGQVGLGSGPAHTRTWAQ